MTSSITARCKCEEAFFESTDPPLLQLVCHCEDCHEASKDDFTLTAFFLESATEVSGRLIKREFTAASGARTTRESCANCGTLLFDRSVRFPTLIGVVARALDPPFVPEPSCHVWVRSKRPGVVISDELPRHAGDLA